MVITVKAVIKLGVDENNCINRGYNDMNAVIQKESMASMDTRILTFEY